MTQADRKRLETMEMSISRRMEQISCVDKISNEEVLQRVNETKTMLDTVGKCKRVVRACAKTWIITAWYNQEKNEGEGYMRKEKNLLSDLMKVYGTWKNSWRQERVAEIDKIWKLYTCFFSRLLGRRRKKWLVVYCTGIREAASTLLHESGSGSIMDNASGQVSVAGSTL